MRDYDVVIVGTGIAGLFTALNIDKSLSILLITKSTLGSGNSFLAQGGIVCCKNKDTHFSDTLKAGCYFNDKDSVELLEQYSHKCIDILVGYGVNFERDRQGRFKFTREGGHSEETILYSKDSTGMEIMECLIRNIRERENIDILEDTLVTELVKRKESVIGVGVLDKKEKEKIYHGKCIVLATGGVGRLYKATTNSNESTGDGIALASEIGASIRNLEFIQFHPTAMHDKGEEKKFLISEAVRGEGGVLKNITGDEFMKKYSDMCDLAPRDIVSRSIFKEMKKTNSDFVYLDITHKKSEFLLKRFPSIYSTCIKRGIDMSKEYIRVSPAQHYMIGGIETDLYGRTSVSHLYACGECASTGVHGANRLASNSLLEGVVFAKRISEDINKTLPLKFLKEREYSLSFKVFEGSHENKTRDNERLEILEVEKIEDKMKETMTKYVSIVKTKRGLLKARVLIKDLRETLEKDQEVTKKKTELRHMLKVSSLIIDASIDRTESKGTHFISSEDEE